MRCVVEKFSGPSFVAVFLFASRRTKASFGVALMSRLVLLLAMGHLVWQIGDVLRLSESSPGEWSGGDLHGERGIRCLNDSAVRWKC